MMSTPSNEAKPHNYEALPCTIVPQQHLHAHSTALTGNIQHITLVPNVPSATPMMNPSTFVPQWSAAITVPQKTPSLIMYKTKGLAILLIVTCVIQFSLGIGMFFIEVHYTLYSGVPFWGAVSYLVAAGLTISAQDSATPCVVKGSFAVNILGAIISCIGVIMACLDIVLAATGCPLYADNFYHYCKDRHIGGIVVYSFLLITNLLLFSVSVSIAVYGYRALTPAPTVPQVYLVQNVVAQEPTSTTPAMPLVCTHSSPSCAIPEDGNS